MLVRPRFRVVFATIAALLPVLALSGCGSANGGSGSADGPFKLVLISDLSGAFASGSKPGAAGVEVAVDAINDAGGVNGRKIDLEVIDGQSNPDVALAAAQKAEASNPLAVLLFGSSAGASKLTPLLQSARIPFISGAISDESIYPPQPGLYQPGLTAKQNAEAIYQFVKQKLNGDLAGKTVDIAAINSPFVDVVIQGASEQLAADGATVNSAERYDYGIASFTTQAGKIARDNPDVVLTLGADNDTIVVNKALAAAGSHAITVGMAVAAAPEVLEQIDSANYYALTENAYARDVPEFVAAADKDGKKDDILGSTFSATGWVAINILAEALKSCDDGCDGAKLNTALEQLADFKVPGGVAYGPITFSSSDHVGASIVKFHNFDSKTDTWSESDPINVG